MIVRTFEAEELVRLPRMSTSDTIALATALVTRAEAEPDLPPTIARALGRVRQNLEMLREGAETRVQEQGQSESKQEWNRALDASWASLRWWIKGWTLLPHPEHAALVELAQRLETVLFPDGLRFITLPFRAQWVESQARLGLIERETLDATIAGLGGQPILDAVRKAHDDFGRALGLTGAADTPPTTSLREERADLADALRRYVLQVTAHADPDDPASKTLADALLLPITTWKTRTPVPVEGGETGDGTPPLEPPAAEPPSQPAS